MTTEQIYEQAYSEADAAEVARIKAILTSPEAQSAPDLAHYLAFETSDSAAKAIAVIKANVVSPTHRASDTAASYQVHKLHGIEDSEIGASGRVLQ